MYRSLTPYGWHALVVNTGFDLNLPCQWIFFGNIDNSVAAHATIQLKLEREHQMPPGQEAVKDGKQVTGIPYNSEYTSPPLPLPLSYALLQCILSKSGMGVYSELSVCVHDSTCMAVSGVSSANLW